ncbi:unnamed protein product [Calypogeia fissa]
MKIEVKLKLSGLEAHEKVATVLKPYHSVAHMQENFFFDGANKELSSRKSVLRLRFYDVDKQCVVTYKGEAVIESGISRGEEFEEEINVVVGRDYVANPKNMLITNCQLIKMVVSKFGVKDFVCLGGFRNIRNVYKWEGLKVELDETQFDFGTAYEVECEDTDPERVRKVLGNLLESNGIEYTYSTKSKFALFRSGKLDD